MGTSQYGGPSGGALQGYLAHQKQRPFRGWPSLCARYSCMHVALVVLGGWGLMWCTGVPRSSETTPPPRTTLDL